MFEAAYRRRLEADLSRWQGDGVIAPATGDAIRGALGPMPRGVSIAAVVGIVGGLLIAAAFLAFVAANWTVIPRPSRFLMLLVGVAGAYAVATWFDRTGRGILADLAVAVGTLIFGAAIALTGQMYHLGEDFAGGMLLWALGALLAAVLTGARGALAVALVAGCVWSGMRTEELAGVHVAFVPFWLVAAVLAVAWNAAAARHLVALAALAWWIVNGVIVGDGFLRGDPTFPLAAGSALMLGGGLLLDRLAICPASLRALGRTLAHYGAFGFLGPLTLMLADIGGVRVVQAPDWVIACALAGVLAALLAAALARRAGPAFAGLALGLMLVVAAGLTWPAGSGEPWLADALLLMSTLSLVVSGTLDEDRPRVVAGWLGLAATIAGITWAVKGSLLLRAAFLAVAGLVAIALATLLGRLLPREAVR